MKLLSKLFKWLFLLSTLIVITVWFYKDNIPAPTFYPATSIDEPIQEATSREEFSVSVNDHSYIIKPKFDYELEGVVVSYHDPAELGDIYHYKQWKDFLNLKDLCVVWGNNVTSGVYNDMKFDSNTWTCWMYWPDSATRDRFDTTALSNNHILSADEAVNRAVMSAEVGDHIRFKGVLAAYENPASNFKRGTSIVRTDTGNGACETIYLDEFKIIRKANAGLRNLYDMAFWVSVFSLTGFLVTFFLRPV